MHAFRAFAQSWLAKVLLGILMLSFVIWGSGAELDANLSRAVIKAGSHKVKDAEFKRDFDNALKQVSQQQGRAVTAQEAVKAGFVDQMLDDLADANSLWELVGRLGVRPSDKLVSQQIAKIQGFADPVTRVFNANTYKARLAENGLTPVDFERGLADEIAENHFATGVSVGMTTPKVYAAVLASLALEERSAAFFAIDPRSIGAINQPTDAQLTAFLNENADKLRRPEQRQISLVRFSAAALAPTMPVNETEVRKQYEQRKAQLTVPERRSFVQVQVQNEAQAQQVGQRIAQGQDPVAAAKAAGATAIPYDDIVKSAVPDPKIGEAAFAMQAGQVTAVQGALGPALIKLTKVTPGKAASFEEARPELEARLRDIAAQEKVFADAGKYGDAHDAGSSLPQAAEAVGAHVYVLGPMTADGKDQFGRPVVGMTDRMLKDAFSTPQGGDTDLTDLGKGEYYALRVDKVIPAALPSLAEVKAPLTQEWMRRELITRMQAKADQLAAQVRGGQAIDKVAGSAGLKVNHVNGVTRANAGQHAELGQALLGALFQKKPGEVYTAPIPVAGGRGVVLAVAQVTSAKPGNPGYGAAMVQLGQQQMERQLFADMGQLVRSAAKARIKPKIDKARALRVIGVNAEETSDAPAKAQ
jgi:peptidyl-prolyl cis-trans isomerase D